MVYLFKLLKLGKFGILRIFPRAILGLGIMERSGSACWVWVVWSFFVFFCPDTIHSKQVRFWKSQSPTVPTWVHFVFGLSFMGFFGHVLLNVNKNYTAIFNKCTIEFIGIIYQNIETKAVSTQCQDLGNIFSEKQVEVAINLFSNGGNSRIYYEVKDIYNFWTYQNVFTNRNLLLLC